MREIHSFEADNKKRAATIPASDFCVCSSHKDNPIHRTDRTEEDMAAQRMADNTHADVVASINRFRAYVSGRSVRVIAEHNDQPFGYSKPSMKGSVERVLDAGWTQTGFYLMLEGRRCGIAVHDVEFLP